MEMAFTAVFGEASEGCIAYVEKLPGATLEESRDNLGEAIAPVLACRLR